MKYCAICNKELLVVLEPEGLESCDECLLCGLEKPTYTHPIFGYGYEIIEEFTDGWCSLRKVDHSTSSYCGEYKEFLLKDVDKP